MKFEEAKARIDRCLSPITGICEVVEMSIMEQISNHLAHEMQSAYFRGVSDGQEVISDLVLLTRLRQVNLNGPLWQKVSRAFGLGVLASYAKCREHGLDPNAYAEEGV